MMPMTIINSISVKPRLGLAVNANRKTQKGARSDSMLACDIDGFPFALTVLR
jgi:hypothetical protein